MKPEKTFAEALNEVQKNTSYSFVGRPDFARIIRENKGAEVIIVSREDGLVTFLFRVGFDEKRDIDTTVLRGDTLANIVERVCGRWDLYQFGRKNLNTNETYPDGWVEFSTSNQEYIKDMRSISQAFVRTRTGKHTVEVLP